MEVFKTLLKYLLLGTVQGLCEFLPVSSSGHLALLQRALGFSAEGGRMTFLNLFLHLGTLIPVVILFRRDILALFQRPYKRLVMLLVATIPAGICGVLLGGKIDEAFAGDAGAILLAVCFLVTAILLLASELVAKRRKRTSAFGWKQSAAMGLMQAVAILPGISRSGSTIAMGTFAGADTGEAARFSFLMSIPVILGGVLFSAKDLFSPAGTPALVGAAEIAGMLLGVAAAAISGYFAIKLVLRAAGKAGYRYFALYLVLLSLITFTLSLTGRL